MAMALTIGLFACDAIPPEVAQTPAPDVPPSEETAQTQSPNPTVEQAKLAVYWLQYKSEETLALSPAKLTLDNVGSSAQAQLVMATKRLLQGPANADVTTTIPAGTKLNSLKVEGDGIHVDLSQDFTSGGGSTSMQGRLGQLIYTASSLAPQDEVWISIDGEPLTVLGGEGLEVSQPITRQQFEQEFSL